MKNVIRQLRLRHGHVLLVAAVLTVVPEAMMAKSSSQHLLEEADEYVPCAHDCISTLALKPAALSRRCMPPGLNEDNARRMAELAYEEGREFRRNLANLRESGVNMETDRSLEILLADQSATERFLRMLEERQRPISGTWSEIYLNEHLVNYFSAELDRALLDMLGEIGGEGEVENQYLFSVERKTFEWALRHFAAGAALEIVGALPQIMPDHGWVQYILQEKNWIASPDKLWFIRLSVRYSDGSLLLSANSFHKREIKSFFQLPDTNSLVHCAE